MLVVLLVGGCSEAPRSGLLVLPPGSSLALPQAPALTRGAAGCCSVWSCLEMTFSRKRKRTVGGHARCFRSSCPPTPPGPVWCVPGRQSMFRAQVLSQELVHAWPGLHPAQGPGCPAPSARDLPPPRPAGHLGNRAEQNLGQIRPGVSVPHLQGGGASRHPPKSSPSPPPGPPALYIHSKL